MNTRIKELAEQCWDKRPEGQLHFDNEKFAELIVKECLMIVYERQVLAPTDDDGYFKVALDMVSKDIEQHFGVEE
jgi:hypothetical protein